MTAPQNFSYPTSTKVAIVVVLTIVIAGFVLAGMSADTDNSDAVTVSGAPGQAVSLDGVEALLPADGAQVLSQQKFGIDLAAGWTGELVLLPGNGSAIAIPAAQLDRSALNEIVFEPGPDKIIAKLPEGVTSCVLATVWDQVRGREASERTETWCFAVT